MSADPYHDHKRYHLAARLGPAGEVSPLCAEPRPPGLRLDRELWTLTRQFVTCRKCLKKMREQDQ